MARPLPLLMSIASSNSRDVGDDEAHCDPLTAETALALASTGTARQRLLGLADEVAQPDAAEEMIELLESLAPSHRARTVFRRGRTFVVVERRGAAAA